MSQVEVDETARRLKALDEDRLELAGRAQALRAREEQLCLAVKMDAVGLLAGGVAHDLNNLLCVIAGRVELATARLKPGDSLRETLETIRKTTERGAKLTQQLLAVSRHQLLQAKVLDLNAVITEREAMLRRLLGGNITLAMVLCPTLKATKADPGQIEQVLMNLCVNACDAMPQGGTLTLETGNLVADEAHCQNHLDAQPGAYVMLAVHDTGCGMDEKVRSHLFEPFFTTKERGKGTGLGLAVAYGIVRQSGGHVCVSTEVGKGTTFKVCLPQADANGRKSRAVARPFHR